MLTYHKRRTIIELKINHVMKCNAEKIDAEDTNKNEKTKILRTFMINKMPNVNNNECNLFFIGICVDKFRINMR